jgi:TorA-specific chaperone
VPDAAITERDQRIFVLSSIELAVALFRGPAPDGWTAIFHAGLPELTARAPSRFAHLTNILKKLQDLGPAPDDSATLDELEAEYVRLFVSAGGGVSAPPYESCHLGGKPRVMGAAAVAMGRRLAQAGLETAVDGNEPPDHLAVELEYLYHLLAAGWAGGDRESEAAGLDFAREVMLPWVVRFQACLAAAQPHPVFGLAAEFLTALLRALDVRPGLAAR